MTASELLRQKADDYRAISEERAETAYERALYALLELALRDIAQALEESELQEAA